MFKCALTLDFVFTSLLIACEADLSNWARAEFDRVSEAERGGGGSVTAQLTWANVCNASCGLMCPLLINSSRASTSALPRLLGTVDDESVSS